jgi:hypothetical protein
VALHQGVSVSKAMPRRGPKKSVPGAKVVFS